MIKVICLGKLKEKYINEFVEDYVKRINKYHKLKLIELKDEEDLKNEAKNIKKYIGSNDFVITLLIEGKEYDSLEFAKVLDKAFIHYDTITFIIGSSCGLDESIKNLSNLKLSFSKMTFPHGIFRGILLEQIYRAFKINNNETYHK